MSMIQCSEKCKYQSDGYCFLEKCSKINSPLNDCPYFISCESNNVTPQGCDIK